MRIYLALALWLAACSCTSKKQEEAPAPGIDALAERYVRLGLTVGQYDGDFVDAYYGPDSLKPVQPKLAAFPKDSLLAEVNTLMNELKAVSMDSTANDTLQQRAKWMNSQLVAFSRRIRIFSGEFESFDLESKDLFGVVAPVYPESYFQGMVKQLDSLLPGTGPITDRFQQMAAQFVLPLKKIDTVFKTTIAEARKRTLQHYALPPKESFTLEYVTGKSWSGYNWYKGNYTSLIQISTDIKIFIERAIDLACHEGYPGHHVYNMLLEKNLYRDKGWVEISLYPLFSPQSLIAEGSANYGIEVAFPGHEQVDYTKNVLLPLAGIDTAGAEFYFKALQLRSKLNYARNEVARGLINGSMTEAEAMRWLKEYSLFSDEAAAKSISFIRKYRSYVINYNYGLDLVKNHIESAGGTAENVEKRWQLFYQLLSNPITPGDLLKTE
jgi:hypothetical protein